MSAIDRLVEEIENGPEGPEVGVFFDLDGTLIAGYSAGVFYQEFLRRMQMSAGEIGRSVMAGLDMSLRGADVTGLVEIAAGSWRGRAEDELKELGERLFVQRIAGMVYPQARALVAAHRRMGHTLVLASSATAYQVEPLARDLEIDSILSTVVEVADGVFTGELGGKVLWGAEKAEAVRRFAAANGIDLERSYAYSNGDEDVPFLEAVGIPHAVNPQSGLAKVAAERGWPAYRFTGRGRPGVQEIVRTSAALAGLGVSAVIGAGVGLLNGSRREAANFASSVGPDASLALAGVNLNVSGEEHLWSHRPAVFIFNHQSSIDMLVVGSLIRRDITGVAKKEAGRDPRFFPVGLLLDVAYVERGNTRQARAAMAPAVEKLRQGISIAIAPEGTRSPTPRVGRFKKGAFHMAMQGEVPIVPIVIRNAGDVMWRNSFFLRPGTIDVTVLEPILTDGWKAEELDDHVAEVRRLFVDTLASWPERGRAVPAPEPARREPPATPASATSRAPARSR